MDSSSLSHAISGSTDRSGHVCAVTVTVVAILSVTYRVVAQAGAAREFLMCKANTRIDNVGINAGPVEIMRIAVIERQIALVDAVEAKSRGRLYSVYRHFLIFFDVCNARIFAESLGFFLRHLG